MDEENRNRKLKEAEKLRSKKGFPFNLFSTLDYDASAGIFVDLGNMEVDVDKKIWYYEEAAKTYLMENVEYSRYQAFQMYEKIAQLCEEKDARRSVEAYKKSGMYSMQCGRESLAAVNFQRAAEILKKEGDLNGSLECLKMVMECYRGTGWKHHRTKAMKDITNVYVELGKFKEAGELFLIFKENIYIFCAFLCNVMEGSPSDLDINGDEKIICDAIENDMNLAYKVINEYIETHAMIEEVKKLLNIVKEKLKPEHDIL